MMKANERRRRRRRRRRTLKTTLVRDGQTSPHTQASSSLVEHVLHYPPPPTRTAL